MSDISFPVSEEPEADLASGDQALPMGVLGAHGERLTSGLDGDHSPHTSGETSIPNQMYTPHLSLQFSTERTEVYRLQIKPSVLDVLCTDVEK